MGGLNGYTTIGATTRYGAILTELPPGVYTVSMKPDGAYGVGVVK